ncbi:MAG: Ig-like domain repeat protein [Acidimicrobiia bacterium]|nr:Ig-like domain repeat protein [Acidimicrobiia bacterium]
MRLPRSTVPVRTIARLSAALALVLPLAGAVTALATQSAPAAASTYQGSALFTPNATNTAQSFTVPPAVTQISINAKGGQGGNGAGWSGASGGAGGSAAAVVDLIGVNPGQTLVISVGRAGGNGGAGSSGGSDGSSGNAGGPGGNGDGIFAGAGGGGGAATEVGPTGGIYLVAGGGGGGGGSGAVAGYNGGSGGSAADPPGGGASGSGAGAGSGGGSKGCNSTAGDPGGSSFLATGGGGGGGGGGGYGGPTPSLCGGAGGGAGFVGAGGAGGGGAGASYVQESTSFGSTISTSTTGGDGSVLITWGQPTSRTSVSSTGATTVGGSRTFTATVAPPFGIASPTPTGSVGFYLNGRLIGTSSLAGGTATLTTADLAGGSDSVRALYLGDDVYASSQAFTSFTMTVAAPQMHAGATPNPSTGNSHLYGTVTPPAGAASGTPVPTGSVHLYNTTNGHRVDAGTYALDGNGQWDLVDAFSNAFHLYTFEVDYPGDGNYGSATTTFSVRVLDQTFTSLSSGLNPAKAGQPIPLTASVGDVNGAVTPTGTVTFLDGSTVLGTATLTNGVASIVTTLSAGTHDSVMARYDGDDTHFGSFTEPTSQRVDPAAPPVADAGSALRARKGAVVTVDGTKSSDPQGEPLTYSWVQISGLPATIADKNAARTAVTLPNKAGTVTLRLTVTNAAGLSSTSDVTVTVSPK